MSINANQDYIQFKNDILKDIREFEKNILEQIKAKYSSIDSTLFNYKDQIDKLEKLTKSSSFNIIELKSKLNNLNEYFSFKQKMENLVFNNDIKLKIYIEEIDKIKTKYDKMLDDNLVIPGILGRNCKFKNLKDYIHNNNNEIARLKYAIDEEKKLTSEFKSKFEVLPRSMINMADSAVRRSNEYTELKQKDIEKFINVKFNENNEKIMEIKVSNLESQKSLDEAIKEFKNEINKILNIKNDIEDILNEKINKLKELRKENENKFKEITKEIEEIKNTENKCDNKILNNTKLINELKYIFKNMNNIGKNKKLINNNNNYYNNDIHIKNENTISNNQTLPSAITTNKINEDELKSIIKRNNNFRKLSFKETINSKIIKDYCFTDIKHKKSSKDLENEQNKSFDEKEIKSNVKTHHYRFNQTKKNTDNNNNNNNIDNKNNSNKKNNNLTKKIEFDNDIKIININDDSSSLEYKTSEDNYEKIINGLNIQSNKNMEKLLDSNKNNNMPISKNEDKIVENKELISQENNSGLIKINEKNEKKELELNYIKSKINNNKNKNNNNKKVTKISNSSDNKRLSQITKFTLTNNNEENDKSSFNNLNFSNNKINLNNKEYKENSELNINGYNYKKESLININKNNKKNNIRTIFIENKNKNNNFNNEIIIKNVINQNNIINNYQKNNLYNNSNNESYQNNNNNNVFNHKTIELNLEAIDSFLNNKNNNKNKKSNISIHNFSSRNDNRNNTKNQSCDMDIKVNSIDLFANAKKKINDGYYNQYNYSFNGKKIKSKFKNKKDEEEVNPTDYLYKLYFDKNIKKNNELKDKSINNLKRIAPVFGRTAYKFYDKNDNHENKNLFNNFL